MGKSPKKKISAKSTKSLTPRIYSKSSFASTLTRYSETNRSDPKIKDVKPLVNSFRKEDSFKATPSKNLKNPRTGRIIIRMTKSSKIRMDKKKEDRAKSETRQKKMMKKEKGIHKEPFRI